MMPFANKRICFTCGNDAGAPLMLLRLSRAPVDRSPPLFRDNAPHHHVLRRAASTHTGNVTVTSKQRIDLVWGDVLCFAEWGRGLADSGSAFSSSDDWFRFHFCCGSSASVLGP